jgi:hypothetical protein
MHQLERTEVVIIDYRNGVYVRGNKAAEYICNADYTLT